MTKENNKFVFRCLSVFNKESIILLYVLKEKCCGDKTELRAPRSVNFKLGAVWMKILGYMVIVHRKNLTNRLAVLENLFH